MPGRNTTVGRLGDWRCYPWPSSLLRLLSPLVCSICSGGA